MMNNRGNYNRPPGQSFGGENNNNAKSYEKSTESETSEELRNTANGFDGALEDLKDVLDPSGIAELEGKRDAYQERASKAYKKEISVYEKNIEGKTAEELQSLVKDFDKSIEDLKDILDPVGISAMKHERDFYRARANDMESKNGFRENLMARIKQHPKLCKAIAGITLVALMAGIGTGIVSAQKNNSNIIPTSKIEQDDSREMMEKYGIKYDYRGLFADETGTKPNENKENQWAFGPGEEAKALFDARDDDGVRSLLHDKVDRQKNLSGAVMVAELPDELLEEYSLGEMGRDVDAISQRMTTDKEYTKRAIKATHKFIDNSKIQYELYTGSYKSYGIVEFSDSGVIESDEVSLIVDEDLHAQDTPIFTFMYTDSKGVVTNISNRVPCGGDQPFIKKANASNLSKISHDASPEEFKKVIEEKKEKEKTPIVEKEDEPAQEQQETVTPKSEQRMKEVDENISENLGNKTDQRTVNEPATPPADTGTIKGDGKHYNTEYVPEQSEQSKAAETTAEENISPENNYSENQTIDQGENTAGQNNVDKDETTKPLTGDNLLNYFENNRTR